MVTIFQNPDYFGEDSSAGACFSNRILLVGQCVLAYLIFIKDIIFAICDKPQEKE